MTTRYTEARNAIDAPEAVGSPVERPVRLAPERAAFEAWMREPVAAGEDPAPWIDGLAAEAAWQAWKHRGATIALLRAELDRCGKDNCMGRKVQSTTTWVTWEAREAAVAAEQKRWRDAVAGMAKAAADNNDLRVYELLRGLNDALYKA